MTAQTITIYAIYAVIWLIMAALTQGIVGAINHKSSGGPVINENTISILLFWPIPLSVITIACVCMNIANLWRFVTGKITDFLLRKWGNKNER